VAKDEVAAAFLGGHGQMRDEIVDVAARPAKTHLRGLGHTVLHHQAVPADVGSVLPEVVHREHVVRGSVLPQAGHDGRRRGAQPRRVSAAEGLGKAAALFHHGGVFLAGTPRPGNDGDAQVGLDGR